MVRVQRGRYVLYNRLNGGEYLVATCRDVPQLERALKEHADLSIADLVDD